MSRLIDHKKTTIFQNQTGNFFFFSLIGILEMNYLLSRHFLEVTLIPKTVFFFFWQTLRVCNCFIKPLPPELSHWLLSPSAQSHWYTESSTQPWQGKIPSLWNHHFQELIMICSHQILISTNSNERFQSHTTTLP